jgi:hypothetical protein
VRRGFALAGGAHANKSRLFAQLREIGGAEVSHAGLNSAYELGYHSIH